MAAGKYNLLIEQGSTFKKIITLKDNAGVVTNLTGATFKSQIKTRAGGTLIIEFTMVGDDLVNGKFSLNLTALQTTALSFNSAVYDIEVVYSNLTVERLIEGNVSLSKEITV